MNGIAKATAAIGETVRFLEAYAPLLDPGTAIPASLTVAFQVMKLRLLHRLAARSRLRAAPAA